MGDFGPLRGACPAHSQRFVACDVRLGVEVVLESDGISMEDGMRVLALSGLLLLAGCGGGGSTTGTNYSDPPPQATIVATPTPKASPSAKAEPMQSDTMGDADAANATE